ncbi:hypothetical protein P8452_73322 [Trifolium repens]|nr:hypothetical protein P8452_73322 [Trifolium repens]
MLAYRILGSSFMLSLKCIFCSHMLASVVLKFCRIKALIGNTDASSNPQVESLSAILRGAKMKYSEYLHSCASLSNLR